MHQKKEKRHIREQARNTAQCGTGNAGRCGSGAKRQPSLEADTESCRLPVWLSHRCGEGTEDVWAEVLTCNETVGGTFNFWCPSYWQTTFFPVMNCHRDYTQSLS